MDIEHPTVIEDAQPILGDEEIDRWWKKKNQGGIKLANWTIGRKQECGLDG